MSIKLLEEAKSKLNYHKARKAVYVWLHGKVWEGSPIPPRPVAPFSGKDYDEYVVEQTLEILGIADIFRQMEKRWRQVLLATFIGLIFPLYVIVLFILHRTGG